MSLSPRPDRLTSTIASRGSVGASFLARALVGWFQATPLLMPDEYIYASISRSLAETGQPLVRASSTHFPALLQPIWLFDRFRLPVLGVGALQVVQAVWKLSLACACIGLYTRTSMAVAAILGTYLLGLGHNFGQTYHFDAILVIAFWILAFSRAGDGWSIDAMRRTARDPQAGSP